MFQPSLRSNPKAIFNVMIAAVAGKETFTFLFNSFVLLLDKGSGDEERYYM
jgi:hypothetical protein